MKRTIYLSLILCVAAASVSTRTLGQFFEGKVVYKNTFTSTAGANAAKQIAQMMGGTQEYYIKGGYYKNVTNGSYTQYQIYSPSEEKLYSKLKRIDTLYWNDVTENSDPIESVTVEKDKEEVLGVKCSVLIIKSRSGSTTFYHNPKYKLDAAAFRNHKLGFWDAASEAGLPLKIVVVNKMFTVTSVATEIAEQRLDDSLFAIPQDMPTKKSRY